MLGGYVIMFTFTVMMLGKLNKTEVRIKTKSSFLSFQRFVSTSLLPECSLAFSDLAPLLASCSCLGWSTTRPTTSSPSSPSGSGLTTCRKQKITLFLLSIQGLSSWSAWNRTRAFHCQKGQVTDRFLPDLTSRHLQIGHTMRHAGISVTVTSITDVMAFGLGAFTIMPGLQAFCVSAAICIALIFLLQVDIT